MVTRVVMIAATQRISNLRFRMMRHTHADEAALFLFSVRGAVTIRRAFVIARHVRVSGRISGASSRGDTLSSSTLSSDIFRNSWERTDRRLTTGNGARPASGDREKTDDRRQETSLRRATGITTDNRNKRSATVARRRSFRRPSIFRRLLSVIHRPSVVLPSSRSY